jgi:hypothetical protein
MRRSVLSLATLLLLLPPAGCGAASSDPLRDAAARTAEAGSSRVTWEVETARERITVAGAIDFDRDVGYLTLTAGGSKELEWLDVAIRFADDGKTYMRFIHPERVSDVALGQEADELRKWFPIGNTADEWAFTAAIPLPGVDRPDAVVKLFEYASAVAIDGVEHVHGERTTHYRATVDVAKLIDASAPTDNDYIEELRKIRELPLEAWIDGLGRARRVVLRFPEMGGEEAGTATIEFFDFGLVVQAPRPAPEELDDDANGSLGFALETGEGTSRETDPLAEELPPAGEEGDE